jgi:cyclase
MLFESQHFHLEKVAEGIYAALETPGGAARSNAGIIDLGDQTLVFDAFLTQKAALDLRRAAEELTGHPVAWLVNSHFHIDHILGSQAFLGVPLIATVATRQALVEQVVGMVQAWRKNASPVMEDMRSMESRLKTETEPQWLAACQAQIHLDRSLLDTLPGSQVCLPDHTFTGHLSIFGTRRTAQLYSMPPAHTHGDAVLVLPEDGVAFLGGMGFFGTQPMLADGDPRGWLKGIDDLAAMDIQHFVPGHGPVGTQADLLEMQDYIQALLDLAAAARKRGLDASQAVLLPLPEPFVSWEDPWMKLVFAANMKMLMGHK